MATPAYGLTGSLQQLQPQNRTPLVNNTPQMGMQNFDPSSVPTYGGGPAYGGYSANYANTNANRDMAIQQSNQGIQALQGYAQPGMAAQGLQADYAGANGLQAQQAAYNNFQSSPGQQFLLEQAERALLRNASAMGGLGGGNVKQELQRQAMGLAQQDFQNQFNNLGAVGDRGMQAAQLQTGLRDSAGNYASQAGAQGASLQNTAMNANAGIQQSAIGADASTYNNALNANNAMNQAILRSNTDYGLGAMNANTSRLNADLSANTALARDRGNYSFTAGQDIANNSAATTSALAQLANQQGAGLSDMYGNYTSNIANLLSGGGASQATSNQALASLLANIATGSQNNFVGASGLPNVSQTQGNLSGIGDMLGGGAALAKVFGLSDARLKTNIRRIGTTTGGNALYSWDWTPEGARIAGPQPTVGVIAQEVNQDAVIVGSDGWLRVDYMRVL